MLGLSASRTAFFILFTLGLYVKITKANEKIRLFNSFPQHECLGTSVKEGLKRPSAMAPFAHVPSPAV